MLPEKYFSGKKNIRYYLKLYIYKYWKSRFFNRIFLVYILITTVSCLILLLSLTNTLFRIMSDQSLLISDQILTSIEYYLDGKLSNAYSVHQKLFKDKTIWDPITEAMMFPKDHVYETDSIYNQQELNLKISQTIYSIDKDLRGVFLYSYDNQTAFPFGFHPSVMDYTFFKSYCSQTKRIPEIGSLPVSSRRASSPGTNDFSIFILNTVKNPDDFTKELGIISLYFNAMNLQQSYRQYEAYQKGDIYIFDAEQNLLFHSSGSYQLPNAFPLKKIYESPSQSSFHQGSHIFNVHHTSDKSFYLVNAYTKEDVMQDVHLLQRNIFFIIALIFVFTLLMNFMITRYFSARIRPMLDTMRQVRRGHLTDFQIQKKYDDEIGFLYTELIQMCSALDDHIQKEYVYQLKQKEMELYTLQTQIDPHFLYNTLETIRMNLFLKGDEETGNMIYILSELFRNSMKTDMIVSIRNEINYAKSYLALYKYRYGDDLEYTFDVPDEVCRYSCIKHILQPVLENALIHGIGKQEKRKELSQIHISASLENNDIIFIISDNGCGIQTERLQSIQEKLSHDDLFHDSIGIYNVSSRLRIVYGPAYRVQIESREGDGTIVKLKIKALRKKELEAYVQHTDC